MHWALQLADHFLYSVLTHSYTKGNYPPHILLHKPNFPSQNLQTAERKTSINFKAPPKLSSICVPVLTLLGSSTNSLNGPTSACSLLAAPIPFNGGDSIPTQAYYVLWWISFTPQALDEETAMSCVARLDHALIIAGAPGQGMQSLIQDVILRTQTEYLPRKPFKYSPKLAISPTRSPSAHIAALSTSSGTIPRLIDPPSLSVFRRELLNKPFILSGFASDWPAMNEHPWNSIDYLRSVGGRGRVVPVEVGKDYRSDDWTQRMMSWDDFLDVLEKDSTHSQTIIYMAQHNLLSQFHALREDILIPDYVFTSPQAPATYPFTDRQITRKNWP
jgi:hypothetical protein